jgi:hypothetical protein
MLLLIINNEQHSTRVIVGNNLQPAANSLATGTSHQRTPKLVRHASARARLGGQRNGGG